ncbi:MAG: glycosyltransferase [Steroidobacteraceae bacterium]
MSAVSRTGAEQRPRVLMVDPSLFTAPYDCALLQGLESAGWDTTLITRPARPGERLTPPPAQVATLFYRHVEHLSSNLPRPLRALAKGLAHAVGWARLLHFARRSRPQVVHLQWVVLPFIDIVGLWLLRRRLAVVLTVHDTVPYNGERLSLMQRLGFDLPIRLAHHVIVHTKSGRQTLLSRGLDAQRISIIAHGPLTPPALAESIAQRDARWNFVAFGELKPYKGLDVLLDAYAQLPAGLQQRSRLIIAGRPRMELAPLQQQIATLSAAAAVELRAYRLDEAQMARLFAESDCFVFPYRQIDASGVYFLTKSLGKWIIASNVGIFAEDLQEGVQGTLIPPEKVAALSAALAQAIERRPAGVPFSARDSWSEIGQRSAAIYRSVHRVSRE